jgi:hypothetical protein
MTGHVGTIVLFWALLSVPVAYLFGAFLAAAKRGPSTRATGPACRVHRLGYACGRQS